MDPKLLFPIMMVALIALGIYRRVRRNIGRQPVQPVRMRSRMIMLAVVGAVFAAGATRDMNLLGALLGGVVGGAALAWFGLQHTKFEKTEQGSFYTPHTYIGAAVSLLLLARIVYRFIIIYPVMQTAAHASEDPFASFQRSPLTLAIFGVLIGYYVFYYAGVLRIAGNSGTTAKAPVPSASRETP